MSGLRKRVFANGASTFYGMLVIAVGQLATVPLFLSSWGTQLYGEWLVISAMPAYLAMLDVGLGPVAANRIAIFSGKTECSRAVVTLHSIWAFQLILAAMIVLLAVGASWLLPLHDLFDLRLLSAKDLHWVFPCLAAQVMLVMLCGVIQAIYRSSLRNARGGMLANTVRLAETMVTIGALMVHWSVRGLVLALLCARMLGLVFLYLDARRYAADLPLGVARASRQELRTLLKPAMGQMTFAFASALQLQGFTLLTNHLLGPVAVAVYNVLRTMTRTCNQAVLVIKWSVYPEFSTLIAGHFLEKARLLHRFAVQLSFWGSIAFCGLLQLFGRQIISIWTLGRVNYDPLLFLLFSIGVVLNSFWSTSSVILTSTNNQSTLGNIYAFYSAIGLLLGYVLGRWFGLHGIALAALLAECGVLTYVFRASCRLVGDTQRKAAGDILNVAVLGGRLLELPRTGFRTLIKSS